MNSDIQILEIVTSNFITFNFLLLLRFFVLLMMSINSLMDLFHKMKSCSMKISSATLYTYTNLTIDGS
jgi:hypothetical protein